MQLAGVFKETEDGKYLPVNPQDMGHKKEEQEDSKRGEWRAHMTNASVHWRVKTPLRLENCGPYSEGSLRRREPGSHVTTC